MRIGGAKTSFDVRTSSLPPAGADRIWPTLPRQSPRRRVANRRRGPRFPENRVRDRQRRLRRAIAARFRFQAFEPICDTGVDARNFIKNNRDGFCAILIVGGSRRQ
jgi:hypothetical protein